MIPAIDPEFKKLIPALTEDEFGLLEQDIVQSKKCRDAIILWNGIIIDGHNRYAICTKHGITFGIREMEFDSREDVLVWMIENQLGRRNLSDVDRIELALLKEELFEARAKERKIRSGRDRHRAGEVSPKTSICQNEAIDVQKALANEAGVGAGTYHRYTELKKGDHPELFAKVQSGEMKIGTAHRLLGKEILKELKVADGMYRYIFDNLPFEDENTNRVIYQELGLLKNLLVDLVEDELWVS